jgi:nucleotide-binding universal stress UspA family protein
VHPTPAEDPRIIVAVDDSAAARWALAWALGEARLRGLPLLIVHVTPIPPYAAAAGIPGHGAVGGLRDAGAELIYDLLAEVAGGPGVRTSGLTLIGSPGDALVRLARQEDILVLGRGTRGFLSRLMRPSVQRHCALHSRAPVISVPAPVSGDLALPGAAHERSRLRRLWGSRRRLTS